MTTRDNKAVHYGLEEAYRQEVEITIKAAKESYIIELLNSCCMVFTSRM